MTCPRLFLVALLVECTGGATASAGEWPLERQFPLVEPPPPVHAYPPPSSVVEDTDGSLLVLVYWPSLQPTRFGETEWPHTSLVRIAPDGSRAFVPPFGAPERRAGGQIDDEILPLNDGSILFTRANELDRLRPNGSIVRFAGTGRIGGASSGDGHRATRVSIATPRGLARFPDGSVVFAEGNRIRRVAPDGIITTIAGTGVWDFGGDGGPATKAQ